MKNKDILISTNLYKVLGFLARNPDIEHYEREIARSAGISYGSANGVLHDLHKDGLIRMNQRGRMCFYRIDSADPIVRSLKIYLTIAMLRPLVSKLRPLADKIILFGSCSRGEDNSESDVDMYIETSDKDLVSKIIGSHSFDEIWGLVMIQPVMYSTLELMDTENKNSEFLSLVNEGIVLWERIPREPGIRGVSDQE